MEKFYIDSYSGIHTWFDVEDGKIINIVSSLNPRMSELYMGADISFVKKDFEARMHPVWHKLHSQRFATLLAPLNNLDSRVQQAHNRAMDNRFKGMSEDKVKKIFNAEIAGLYDLRKQLTNELLTAQDELLRIHNFEVKIPNAIVV